MSNEEKRRRALRLAFRKRWTTFQFIVMSLVAALIVIFGSIYYLSDKNVYIEYTEASDVDYKVYLKDNEFYEEEYMGKDQAYIATLIENVVADFTYEICMDKKNVDYEYSYRIDAQLEIFDKHLDAPVYNPTYVLVEEKTCQQNSSDKLVINEEVSIDYNHYNNIAKEFVSVYELTNVESSLVVRMHVNVISTCEEFEGDATDTYTVSLLIPLTNITTSINISSSIPQAENKILACSRAGITKAVALKTIYFLIFFECLVAIILAVFLFVTRDSNTNYASKVARIVRNYKSYIQQIKNRFNTAGYQVLQVNTFNELLEIRDTLQSPILMSENEDRTMTKFIIPGNNKLLYVHEIKIENYDDIYEVKDEKMVEEPKEELVEVEPTIELDPIVEAQEIEVVNNQEEKIEKTTYGHNYSFEARLSLSKEEVQNYYQTVTKFAKEYGVKVSRSFKKERIHLGRKHIATMVFKGKTLCILFPLDPNDPAHEKYNFVDMSGYSKYEENPSMIKITSNRKLKTVIQIIEKVLVENGIEDKNLVVKDTKIKLKSKKTLLKEGLIKVNN